ncbi:MAG: helix-turn-helix domain-containing protein [Beijerinckiaceae bacterium]
MSKVADSIRRSLQEAVSYAKSEADESAYGIHVPERIDVKAIRTNLGMTQEEFAGRFGFSVNTLRHWEQGSRQPEGPTRAYLLGHRTRAQGSPEGPAGRLTRYRSLRGDRKCIIAGEPPEKGVCVEQQLQVATPMPAAHLPAEDRRIQARR